MERRRLGANGPLVGCVGLGGMSIAGAYGPTDERQSFAMLAAALELGLDHIDTADIYGMGRSEELIGRFLKDRPRARVRIASKGGIRFVQATGERRIDNSPAYLRTCLEKSLKRLGRDCIDLYYVHRRESDRPIEDVVGALADWQREGLIGGIGLSEVSPETLRRAHKVHPIAAVQSEYSLWTRQPEAGLLSACRDLGVAFVAFSPLGRGIFSDTPPDVDTFASRDVRRNQPRFVSPNYTRNLDAVASLQPIAERKCCTTAQLALSWTLSQGANVHVIPGTRTAEHVKENIAAASRYLSRMDKQRIEEALPEGFPWGERYTPEQFVGVEVYDAESVG